MYLFIYNLFIQRPTRRSVRLSGANQPSTQEAPTEHLNNDTSNLIIKFPFKLNKPTCDSNKDHSRKRINRNVMLIKRKNEKLLKEKQALQRSVWRLQKQVQRFNIPTGSNSESPKLARASNKSTPIKKAENLIRKSGLSPCTIPKVKKALVLHNVMLKGLKTSSKKSQKQVLTSTSMHMKSTRCNCILSQNFEGREKPFRKKPLKPQN